MPSVGVYYIEYPLADVIICEVCRVSKGPDSRTGTFKASSRRQNYTRHLMAKHRVRAEDIKVRCSVCGQVSSKPRRMAWRDIRSHHCDHRHDAVAGQPRPAADLVTDKHPPAPAVHVALGHSSTRDGTRREENKSFPIEQPTSAHQVSKDAAIPEALPRTPTLHDKTPHPDDEHVASRNSCSPTRETGTDRQEDLELKTIREEDDQSIHEALIVPKNLEIGKIVNFQSLSQSPPTVKRNEPYVFDNDSTVLGSLRNKCQEALKNQEKEGSWLSNKSTIISAMCHLFDVAVDTAADPRSPVSSTPLKTERKFLPVNAAEISRIVPKARPSIKAFKRSLSSSAPSVSPPKKFCLEF